MNKFVIVQFAAAVMIVVVAGCRKETQKLISEPPHPVHGLVTYQGKPATGFRVTFYPLKEFERAKFAPTALTDENGEFQLRSYRPGDGAPPGEYAVTLTWPRRLNPQDDESAEVDQLQGRYANPRNSKFHVSVKAEQNELSPFVLQ